MAIEHLNTFLTESIFKWVSQVNLIVSKEFIESKTKEIKTTIKELETKIKEESSVLTFLSSEDVIDYM